MTGIISFLIFVVFARSGHGFVWGAKLINYRNSGFFRGAVERTIIGGYHNILDRTMMETAGGR
jgi:hypothetical protein